MKRLVVNLFGPFEVLLDGNPVTSFESGKVKALLAYLAAEAHRPQAREHLAGLLWPDWPQKSAMSNLRYALADLRKNIGDREAEPPFLLITRETIQLNLESNLRVDVLEFHRALGVNRDGAASGGRISTAISELASAIDLYRGDFLQGFSNTESSAFEDWQRTKAEHYNRLVLLALDDLADLHAQAGAAEDALRSARRAIEIEAWHEPAHQQIMRLLALDGRRSAALAQYGSYRKALADELGVEPSQEARRLYEMIRDENLEGIRHGRTAQSPVAAELPPEPGEPPFKGLQYFDVSDEDLFFGREALTRRLVRNIHEMSETRLASQPPGKASFLAVVGASGSGKSSVIRAGVIPALIKGAALPDGTLPPKGSLGWSIHVFTPTAHPLEALANSLTREADSLITTTRLVDDLSQDARSLHLFALKGLQNNPSPLPTTTTVGQDGKNSINRDERRLLLIVDQFEELFTLCRSETERSAFIDNLMTAVDRAGLVSVVIILRADFYAHCADYAELRQAVSARQEYIGAMDYHELRRAIEEPARVKGWHFAPGLVDLLLRDVGAGEDHAPEPGALPLLEHALLETWRRRAGRTLTLSGYQEAGGVQGAIAQTAESTLTRMTPEQQAQAKRIFVRLTNLGEGTQDTRRRASLHELVSDSPEGESLLHTLANARLVTLAEDYAEVAHEALIREWPTLRRWLSEDREGLILHRRLTEAAQAWAELDRNPGDLYRGVRLSQALEWMEELENAAILNPLEQEFLSASQALAEGEATEREAQRQSELEAARRLARTQRQRTGVLSIGLTVTILLTVAALWFLNASNLERTRANLQAQVSFSRQLAAQSLAIHEDRLDLALLLAAEALTVSDTVEAQSSLLSSLHHEPRLWAELHFNNEGLNSIAIQPDSMVMATGVDTGLIQLWDITHPAEPAPLGLPLSTVAFPIQLFFSQDGRFLSTTTFFGNDVNSFGLWDLSLPEAPIYFGRLQVQTGIPFGVPQMAFRPDAEVVAFGAYDGQIYLLDITNPAAPALLGSSPTVPRNFITSLQFSADGKILAAGISDQTIQLLDVADPAKAEILGPPIEAHTEMVAKLAFHPSESLLASGSQDGAVFLWDLDSPASPRLLVRLSTSPDILALAFNRDGSSLIAGSHDGSISLWDISQPTSPILSLRTFSDALQGWNQNWMLDPNVDVAFSTDLQLMATGGCTQSLFDNCMQSTLRLWDLSVHGGPVQLSRSFTGHSEPVSGIAFSSQGQILASASADHTLRLWDLSNPDSPLPLGEAIQGHTDAILTVAYSPDGKFLASGSADKTIRLWDVSDPKAPLQPGPALSGHNAEVKSLAFSPDGKILASGGADSTILLWEVKNPAAAELLGEPLQGHIWTVADLAFSPDGRLLASGGLDGNIFLWDVNHPEKVVPAGKLTAPLGGNIFSLAFSPHSDILAAGTGVGQVYLWDVSDPTAPKPAGQPLAAGDGPVNSLAFSPGGKWLAAGNSDHTVRLWDVTDPNFPFPLDQPLDRHSAEVRSIAFSPDGKSLASAGADGMVVLWDVSVESWLVSACRLAGRNLTQAEWRQYFSEEPYRKTCPQWEEGN